MFAEFTGPEPGSINDSTMMGKSGFLQRMASCVNLVHGPDGPAGLYYGYGDPAYKRGAWLAGPHKGKCLTGDQRRFNVKMSRLRIGVEWAFGQLIEEWGFFGLKKAQKIQQAPVSNRYRVAALLTNCHSCLYGNLASGYFDVPTPDLEAYLAGKPNC